MKEVSQDQNLKKCWQKKLYMFLGSRGKRLFRGAFLHFSFSNAHISSSKHQKKLKVAEHVHIHVLQHPTNLQVKIKRRKRVAAI